MLIPKFEKLINFIRDKKVIILSHDLVDIDALASIACMNYFLKEINHNNCYIYHSELTKSTNQFCSLLTKKFGNFQFEVNLPNFSELDVVIILDTSNLENVAFPDDASDILRNKKIVFIDHHKNSSSAKENEIMLDIMSEEFNSTSEIIFEMIEYYKIQLTLPYKYLIIAGIITDTGFFKHANKDAFRRLAILLEDKIAFQDVLSLLKKKIDISEKIAKIKGVQRVKMHRINQFLVGVSHVSNFRVSVASSLLNLGFDIAIVYSKLRKGTFITTRAKKHVCLESGLNLGNVLEKISNGSGGGHDGAASVFIEKDFDKILNELIELIQEILIR